ncbi:BRCA1-associated ATM activator 1 [Entomortierella chlamydospora]|uniref:BRCA1-associated ATM activator 1 n=1 Tax=Entomortierella chlamydospora TaxID=101097 RepID=A0A9P6MYQ2_9FUNG|nr:BRCA1-associated ATM activator 1 [Entomortierella chlamydospora]
MLVEWSILDIFQACLAPDQDYRVSCVALRLLGFLLKHDTNIISSDESGDITDVWQRLETRHPTILDFMIENTMGEEAMTRYSCWFALEYAVKSDGGARWLLESGRCADMVSTALKDTSTYVLTAACRFLVAIIENRSVEAQKITAHDTLLDSLLGSISLYKLIHAMMTDQDSESNRVAGLEFLWMTTDSRSNRGAAFLRQSQLLFSYMDMLMDDSRLVRSRALDILCILLESNSNPLSILGKEPSLSEGMELDKSDDQAMFECFNYLLDQDVLSLMTLTDSLKALHVATGILDAMIKPLSQSSEMHGAGSSFKNTILSTVLWTIQAMQENIKAEQNIADHISPGKVVVQGEGKLAKQLNQPGFQELIRTQSWAKPSRGAASRGGTLPKTVVLSALKALQSLALLFPETVKESTAIDIVLSILFDQKLCSDQRVFKACLTTLPIVLKTKVQNGQLLDEQLFASAMTVILGLLRRSTIGSTSLRLILTAIREFFADEILGRILALEKIGSDLSNALDLKLYDIEWDIRDNVIEFIGALFADGGPDHGVTWALKHDLLESIFQKLSDEEAYVRAASVHALEAVMRDSRGWKGMCSKNLDERLSSQLPSLIKDSEAFVRRAVLEAMICLASERDSATIIMVHGTNLFQDAKFMSRLTLDDSDWEVRIRACEFIAAVWAHCLESGGDELRSSKRQKDSYLPKPSSSWFYDIRGDKILVEATQDSSRLVRLTSVETLKKIKMTIEEQLGSIVTEYEASVRSADEQGKGLTGEYTGKEPTSKNSSILEFYTVLRSLDFERLDATTSMEQLYEEVLNVERVEDVVMEEAEDRNDGNNVLDCY